MEVLVGSLDAVGVGVVVLHVVLGGIGDVPFLGLCVFSGSGRQAEWPGQKLVLLSSS